MNRDEVIKKIITAILAKDWDAYGKFVAEDVRWFTPLLAEPIVGKNKLLQMQSVVLGEIIEDFRYADVAHGEKFVYLFFTGRVGDVYLEGTDRLNFNEEGLVQEFYVDGRPLDAVMALGNAVQNALKERGIEMSA